MESCEGNNTSCNSQAQSNASVLTDYIQKQLEGVSYEIDKIVDYRKNETEVSYNVKWVAHTWIPESILASFQHLIDKFWEERKTNNQLLNVAEQVLEESENEAIALAAQNNNKSTSNGDDSSLAATDVNSVSDTFDCDKPEIQCPKCDQQVFLKSNLDVHMLFCNEKNTTYPPNVATEKQPVVEDNTSNEMIDAPVDVNTVRDSLKILQTFEYIPLGECNQTCRSCTERFPVGSSISELDVTELLCNSNKKVISDQVEVFECLECHQDYLYKQPTDTKRNAHYAATTAFTMLKARRFLNKPYKCPICNRGFDTEQEMLSHESKHSNTAARYSCAECKEKFSTRSMLQEHYKSTLNTCAPRTCDICSKEFVHANHLRRHMSIHAGFKPFVCEICSHAFNQKSDLKRHLTRHSVEGKLLACIKCSLIFDSAEQLKEHSKTHSKANSNRRPEFKCELCSKVFGRKSHYKRHLTIHEGLKPHVCAECNKAFNQRTDLKRHHLSHVRKSQIVALKTETLFNSDQDVNDGEMINKDIRYLCQICDDVFATQAQYDEHEIIHKRFMNTDMTLSNT